MRRSEARCFVPDPERFDELQRAVEVVRYRGWGRIRLHRVTEWSALLSSSTDSAPELIILDPCSAARKPLDPVDRAEIRRRVAGVVRAHPRSAVLLYPSSGCLTLQEGIELSRVGVAASLVHQDGPDWMARRLRASGNLAEGYALIDSLADLLGTRYLELLRAGLPVAYRNGNLEGRPALSVGGLAELWMRGAKKHHLERALRREGLPGPGWLVRWVIALHATLLRMRSASWESVAVEIGFRDREKLAEFTKRLAGRPPSGLRGEDLAVLLREEAERRNASFPRREQPW